MRFSLFFLLLFKTFTLFAEDSSGFDLTHRTLIVEAANNEESSLLSQEKFPTTDFKSTFTKMLFSLFGLLALIFLTFWMFKRLMRNRMRVLNHERSIKIIEKRTLSPKTFLYLVEVENEKILLFESSLQVKEVVLSKATTEDEPNS